MAEPAFSIIMAYTVSSFEAVKCKRQRHTNHEDILVTHENP